MTLRDSLLPMISSVRAIPGQMGLRPYTVEIVTGNWTGSNTGRGAPVVESFPVTEGNGQPPKVRAMNTEELALSGLGKGSIKIGPITPPFPGGGSPLAALKAQVQDGGTLHVRLTGPDLPNGATFAIQSWNADHALHETITVSPISEPQLP